MNLYLYPTDAMKQNVEELYALLLYFFDLALDWYSASRTSHVLRSIKPYSLKFADVQAQIDSRSRSIDLLATTMAQNELRDLHDLVKASAKERQCFHDAFQQLWPILASVQTAQRRSELKIEGIQDLVICTVI